MSDFDGERLMILVRRLAARKSLNRYDPVARCDATVQCIF